MTYFDTFNLMRSQNLRQPWINDYRNLRVIINLFPQPQNICQAPVHNRYIEFRLILGGIALPRFFICDRLVVDRRIIEHNSELSTRIMQRLRNKDRACPHPQGRSRSERVIIPRIFIDQRHRELLAEQRFLILDLEYRKPIDVSISQGQTLFVRPRFVAIFDATVGVNVADLAAFPGWFLGCTGWSGGAGASEWPHETVDGLRATAVEPGGFV